MNQQLLIQFEELLFETCRNQMDEVKNYNGADAGEKMRRCYNKFYFLLKHQNEYYSGLSQTQFDEMLNK